jgi:hypothetical protein
MNELLGIIDAIEARIMEGKKVPFTDKVVVHEGQILMLLDKLRIVAGNDSAAIRKAVEIGNRPEEKPSTPSVETTVTPTQDAVKAHIEALRIREDAAIYADNVLAHLQLLVTKMQKNIIKIEQNLENGRTMMDRITDTTKDTPS